MAWHGPTKEEMDADRRQQEHERDMAAKRRYRESRFASVLANPTGFNRWEAKAAQEWQAEQDAEARERRQMGQEMAMQKLRNEGAQWVAFENRQAQENQGLGVGRLTHGYEDDQGIRHQGSLEITEAEKRLAEEAKAKAQLEGDKYRADKDLEGKKYGADTQVKAITEKGKADLAIEQQRGKTATEVARISGDAQVDAAETTAMATATEKERARQLRYAEREQRDYERWLRSNKKGLTIAEQAEFNKMSPEEQRQFWMKKSGRAAAGNGSQGGGSNWKKNLGW